jgi:hypothetical protein
LAAVLLEVILRRRLDNFDVNHVGQRVRLAMPLVVSPVDQPALL